jgi:hypothetical protein
MEAVFIGHRGWMRRKIVANALLYGTMMAALMSEQ